MSIKDTIIPFNWDSIPEILKVDELAVFLRINRMKAYELCRSKDFPCFRVNRSIRIHKAGLKKWIESQYRLNLDE